MSPDSKKLVLVSATSTPVTGTREKASENAETSKTGKAIEIVKDGKKSKDDENLRLNLAQILYIRYHVAFRKNSMPMLVLFDSNSKVNAIHPTFAQELGLPIRPTDVRAQEINSTMLDTFRMVVIAFSVTDKANQVRFFKETFLVANISLKVVLKMLFLTLSAANIDFLGWELWWKT